MRIDSHSAAEHKTHPAAHRPGLTLHSVWKAAVCALALFELPKTAAAGSRSLLQAPGPALAPPAPAPVFKNPLIVANVTLPPPPVAPPPPSLGPAPLHDAAMNGTGLAIPATATVSSYNLNNRASLTFTNAALAGDSRAFALRSCLLCDATTSLQTPPSDRSTYVYPAAPPDGFSFLALDHEIDVFHNGVKRDPDGSNFRSAYYVGSSGLDATLMALSTGPFASHSSAYYQPVGSDAPNDVSYTKWRMCSSSSREWVGVDSLLPLDSAGKSYLSLTGPGVEGRLGAWPALRQKAYSKFLLEHPELSNDASRPGLQNIVGNNPLHAINVLGCTSPTVINPHTPVGFGQTPVFGPLQQTVQSLLANRQQFMLMTTISDRIFTRDGSYDESNDSVTYTYGANLRRAPLGNFGQTLIYTSPRGGTAVIVPEHCYQVEVQDASQGLFKLTSPWGFSLTTSTGIDGTTGPRSITVTADLLWAVGDRLYAGTIDQP